MNRKALFVAPLAILCIVGPVRAQLTVNPDNWKQRDGLTVASAQRVTAKPTKLRLFTTLTACDKDARQAVRSLAEKKKSARDKLQSLGAKPTDVTISAIQILEWQNEAKGWMWAGTDSMHVPDEQPGYYTAYAAVQVDWEIKERAGDELILMPIDLVDRIRKTAVFGIARTDPSQNDFADMTHKIYMLFVGEISEEAGTDATKRAYDEANAQAMELAATTNRTLGKLAAMTPRVDGAWFWYWGDRYTARYVMLSSSEDGDIPHPMSEFSPLPSEVFSTDPADLHRTYSIDLRFELK